MQAIRRMSRMDRFNLLANKVRVCLVGLGFDSTTMRIAKQRAAWVRSRPGLGQDVGQ